MKSFNFKCVDVKTWIIWFFSIMFLLYGIGYLINSDVASFFSAVVIAGLLFILGYKFYNKNLKTYMNNQAVSSAEVNKPNTYTSNIIESVHIPSKNDIYLPNSLGGVPLAYKYRDIKLCIIRGDEPDYTKLKINDSIEFVKEPTNEYDKNAIAVVVNDTKIGYVYKGTIQSMINNYIMKNFQVLAYVSEIEPDKDLVKMYIGFYSEVGSKDKIIKKFNLIANSNEEMQNNIELCSVGDEISIDYDYEKEKFSACDDAGLEIGYMPKVFDVYAEENGDTSFSGFIDNIYENDNDKYVVTVCIIDFSNEV